MILKFVFLYKNSNKDYFLKIMQNLANEFDLKHSNMTLDSEFLFFVNGNDDNLGLFADSISNRIPLSLYFIFKSVDVVKEIPKESLSILDKSSSSFDFDLIELNNIKDIDGEYFCDIFSYPKHKISFDITFNQKNIKSKQDLLDSMQNIVLNLKSRQNIEIQTTKGKISLCIDNKNFDLILANDISTISLYTRANKDELDALATFEKPIVKLKIKDVFINELGFKSAKFILPYDPILSILSSFLIKFDIPFLYLKYTKDSSDGLYYKSQYSDRFFEIVLGDNGYFIEKNFLDSKISLDSFIESSFIHNNPMLIFYISTNNPSIFRIQNISNLIKIDFDINPKNLLKQLSQRNNGTKLIQNYKNIYKDRIDYIDSFGDDIIFSQNILDILRPISVILGYTKELKQDEVFRYADRSLRDIGPRIDFKTINVEGNVCYDPLSTISSTMSFTLAGVENEVICYGIFDSLADFFINIIRDVNINYNIKDIGIIGNLFINKIFFNKITKKFPQNFTLHYPKYVDLKQ
ncbi:hypothetical protein [Helicobacter sp. MIT 99-5507]|uniref:hypothetical protein n=1 Tax=Helicobacter sp. MIT 99-5507 TaxID=152489 RepID=UPI000E1F839A|nr:hypothetical protein [Helicobacter sp. MIT 99-5507]RDU56650.1 hypothetical protein CQA42_07490 [Helicobacter sp. MIT 99-5507]